MTGTYFVVEPDREQLVELAGLVEEGRLRPAIDSVFPLGDAAKGVRPGDGLGQARQGRAGDPSVKTTEEKGAAFRALHAGEPFVIPNPWDVGSARALEALGFAALATTSSGFAFTLGRLDGSVTLDDVASHVASMTNATDVPVSVDLENGYGADPGDAARAIIRVAEAGAVGGSIEDWDPSGHLYDAGHAAERVAAAAEAAHALPFPFTLTARAENHIRGVADFDDTIARLQAYQAAGADVLFAPGLQTAGGDSNGVPARCPSRSTCWPERRCRWPRSSRRAHNGSASAGP